MYYFVSDIHLGLDYLNPAERERKFASFLNSLPPDTKALFLLGDIFDFWYEYKNVIPRGFTRVLGALSALTDRGVSVYFFNGNHDIWTYSYLQNEVGVKILSQPYVVEFEGKRFCIGHGDGLGNGDYGYKILKWIFNNKFLQFLFSNLHPRWAFRLAHSWSKHNRLSKDVTENFRGNDERIVMFAEDFQKNLSPDKKIDFFIFGHYHYNVDYDLSDGSKIFILGEWIKTFDYLVYENGSSPIKHYYK